MKFLNQDEGEVIRWMITYYCTCNHKGTELCNECNDLLNYAVKRNMNCPHGVNKPVCSSCEIHCYKDAYRLKIRDVMKFSGPKIIFRKPLYGIKYLIKKKFRSGKIKKPSR
ncbi:MAG TPA: nitrous oxide-stimulated promoter family protein [Spirochaetota bacterium]|nr:nitrous oxide-stimulated promoter family protein [Spirochaetota bacterium]HPS86782.1 nitrous oxide-stimulated promoter family protein [Spirochaetota bacterium]